MLKVPFYTLNNYSDIIAKTYEQNDKSDRFLLSDFFDILNTEFVSRYSDLDTRKLWEYFANKTLNQMIPFGWTNKKLQDIIIAVKLLLPTMRACDYFLRNCKKNTHGWLDVIMPRGTPILSFSDGVVTRIKQRDGVKKDEWNCVVIQTWDKRYSYKHMDTVSVKYWDIIKKWDQVWTCWSTWQSTQYHLHFQIDAPISPFTPYRSNQLNSVLKNTLDPLPFLRDIFRYTKIFVDMPLNTEYKKAIESLYQKGIVKWSNQKIFPDSSLPRRQAALVFDKICKKYNIYWQIPVINPTFSPYSDTNNPDPEFQQAIKNLQKYWIIVWSNWQFFPDKEILWEEWIAILGRMLFNLKDQTNWMRYKPYVSYFETHSLTEKNRKYLWKYILRKDAFLVLYKSLKSKNLLA